MSIFKHPLTRTIAGLCILAAASSSWAHARWKIDGSTPPRSTVSSNKTGPCGDKRTNSPAIFQAGDTIEVEFESVIYHEGEFRIAFSEKDDKGFDDYILMENIQDFSNQKIRKELITLPNIECDACTLQLIQTMPDKGPNGGLYYSCADIQLTASGSSASSVSSVTGVSSESSSSSSIESSSSSIASVSSESSSTKSSSSSLSNIASSSSEDSGTTNEDDTPKQAGSTHWYFLLLMSLCLFKRRKS